MFYPKLAVTNIGKNRKNYVPYILTCVLTVMMYYVMDAISKNEGLSGIPGTEYMMEILRMASSITGIFSAIFLFYTNSFLIKQRKKEFGLYQVLGMDKRNLTKMIVWEMLITAAVSVGIGLLGGLLLGKLMFLILLKMIRFTVTFAFSIEVSSVVQTMLLFVIIFAVNCCFNLVQVQKANPVELLHGGNTGEREPKAKWLLTLVGIVALGGGYAIALIAENPLAALYMFFVAVILVIIGTYALFMAGSIAILKLLKKNKNFYYKPGHFTAVSGMIYRMKQNAAGLANICIMSTIVLVLISTTVSLYAGVENMLETRYPSEFNLRIYEPDEERETQVNQIIEEELKKAGAEATGELGYHSTGTAGLLKGTEETLLLDVTNQQYSEEDFRGLIILPVEDYNAMENKNVTLNEGEALIYAPGDHFNSGSFTLQDKTYRVREYLDTMKIENRNSGYVVSNVYLILPDMEEVRAWSEQYAGGELWYDYYFDLSGEEEACKAAEEAITARLNELGNIRVESRTASKESFYTMYGGFLFLGVFVGALFLMATVLIIYYKQISEGYDDRNRFQIMKKVGMSQKEIKQTIRGQVLMVFFLPLGTAVVHIAVAFKVLTRLLRMLNLVNVRLELFCTAGTVLVFGVFYVLVFLITSREYYRIVR